MTTTNRLTAVDTINDGDQFPIWSSGNGDTRRVAASTLAAYVQGETSPNGGFGTQYATPTATGQTTTVTPLTTGASVWLEMTPQGAYAAGTIVLPPAALSQDGQEILVTSTLAVTALTVQFVNSSGATVTVVGAPTTLAANGFFRMRYDGVFKLWIRIG